MEKSEIICRAASAVIVIPPREHDLTLRIECQDFCRFREKAIPKVSLQKVYEDYLAFRVLRPSTVKGYDRVVKVYLADFLDRDLGGLPDEEILKKFVEIRTKSGEAQAALCIRVFKALYAYAGGRFGIPERNPGKIVRLAGLSLAPVRKTRFIQKHDLPIWYRSVASLSNNRQECTARDIFLTGLFLGLRKTEIMSLKWSDIDFRARTLTARATKNHRDHTLPLPPFVLGIMNERRKDAEKENCVFAGKNGLSPIRDIDDSRLKVIAASKVDFTLHDLRRTFATISAEIGIPPYLLKKILNHKSGDVTEGYVISTPEILRGAILKISKRIEDLCRIKTDLTIHFSEEALSSSG
jgi:integrase